MVDESDNELGRSITDGAGRFVFTEFLTEGDYRLLLEDGQKEELKDSEIYLAKNPKDVLFYLNDMRAGVFAFKKLSAERPYSLYSLKEETERGRVVNKEISTLKGRFEYNTLPKDGVRLKLMDELENVVQITEVDENGDFEFENFSTNKNYFIAVESKKGLSGVYEIYLSGEQKNVLVNSTSRFVFSFNVLPSLDVVLSESFENDVPLGEWDKLKPRYAHDVGRDTPYRSYYEYDLKQLQGNAFNNMQSAIESAMNNYQVTMRISNERQLGNEIDLEPISDGEIEAIIEQIEMRGVHRDRISYQRNGVDQALIYLR